MLQPPSTQINVRNAPLPSQLPPPRQSPKLTRKPINASNQSSTNESVSTSLTTYKPGRPSASRNVPVSETPSAAANTSASANLTPTILVPPTPKFNVIPGKELEYSLSPRMRGDLHLRTHPDIPSDQELLNKWSMSTANSSSVPAVAPQLSTQQPNSIATIATARKSTGNKTKQAPSAQSIKGTFPSLPSTSVPPPTAASGNAEATRASIRPQDLTPAVKTQLDSLKAFLVAIGQLPPSPKDIRTVSDLDPRRDYTVVKKPDFDLGDGGNTSGTLVPDKVMQNMVAPVNTKAATPNAVPTKKIVHIVSSDDEMDDGHIDKRPSISRRVALAETQVNMAIPKSPSPAQEDVLMEETTPSSTCSDYHELQVNPFLLARTEYKCLWEGCTSYLNNVEFLEKHVSVRHCRDANRDPRTGHYYCRWPPCHDRRGFSTKKNIMMHVIHKHLRPLARICLAEGCGRVFETNEDKIQHMAQVHPELMVSAHSLLPEYLKSTPIAVAQPWTTQEKAKFERKAESRKPRPIIPTFDRSLYGGEFPDFDTDPKSWPSDDELQRTKRIKPARGGPGDIIQRTAFQPLGKTFYWRQFALEQTNTTVPNVAVERALAERAAGRENTHVEASAPAEARTQLSQSDTAMDEKSLEHLATLPKERLADLTWRVMSRSSPLALSRRASAKDIRAMRHESGSQDGGESSDRDELDSEESDTRGEDVMQVDDDEEDELEDDEL